jgi:hypothetical protein
MEGAVLNFGVASLSEIFTQCSLIDHHATCVQQVA